MATQGGSDTGKMPLEYFYEWESQEPARIFLTQPTGGGAVRDLNFGEAGSEVRRIAAWLIAQGWPAGSMWRSSARTAPTGCWPTSPS